MVVRSPAGINSRSAPRPNSFVMFAKSNGRFLSANAILMSGLQAYASPLAACGARAIPVYPLR